MLNATIIPVTPFQQNCTILFDDETREGVIVDPGGDVEHLPCRCHLEVERLADGGFQPFHVGIDDMPALQKR